MAGKRPESLEGRWDILYRDYPEVYEEWGQIPMLPRLVGVIAGRFPLEGKVMVDVGSGTGLSTFDLAEHAGFVIGVEIEEPMKSIATDGAKERGIENVRFEIGDAEHLPLEDDSVDVAVAATLGGGDVCKVAAEMERVVRPGGLVLREDVAPGWYGGELMPVITGKPRDETPAKGSRDDILAGLGYEALDVFKEQEYGTVERVVRTYGFIHSKRAIDYIREHNMTTIRWKFRVRFKAVA
jgi:ubiquinone/menaquinone biosynthesis C-methylase UbiE